MNDASVQSHILCHQIGVFNMHQEFELSRIIEFHGPDMEATRIKMVKAMEAYRAARPRLKWFFPTPIKFFQSDIWHDPNSWPWDTSRTNSWATVGMRTPEQGSKPKIDYDIRPTDPIDAGNKLWAWKGAIGTDMEKDMPQWIREELGMETKVPPD